MLAQSWHTSGIFWPTALAICASSLRNRLLRRSSAKLRPASSRSNHASDSPSIGTAPRESVPDKESRSIPGAQEFVRLDAGNRKPHRTPTLPLNATPLDCRSFGPHPFVGSETKPPGFRAFWIGVYPDCARSGPLVGSRGVFVRLGVFMSSRSVDHIFYVCNQHGFAIGAWKPLEITLRWNSQAYAALGTVGSEMQDFVARRGQ